MHAHNDTPATYTDFFEKLASLPRRQRIHPIGPIVIAFPIVQQDGSRFFLRAVEGGDSAALVLNTTTGVTRENFLEESEMLSEASHILVAPTKRRAAIEFVRRGPKAQMMSVAIEGILRRHFRDLENTRFEFAPIVDRDFIAQIDSFSRIRVANMRVTRPNASWTEHYNELSAFMEQSDGDKVEVGVRATGGEIAESKWRNHSGYQTSRYRPSTLSR
jgi:hypothetical protein